MSTLPRRPRAMRPAPRLVLAAMIALASAAASFSPAAAQSLPEWAAPSRGVGDPPPVEGDPPCPPLGCSGGGPEEVPVDGGLALLALAGGAYACGRLRERRGRAATPG